MDPGLEDTGDSPSDSDTGLPLDGPITGDTEAEDADTGVGTAVLPTP